MSVRDLRMKKLKSVGLLVAAISIGVAVGAAAQTVNPATQQPPDAQAQQKPDERPHTWEMPPIDVYGKAPLKDDDRIGEYAQPRWTADRLLGETRVYVIPKGKVEFEYWMVPETPRDGLTDYASSYEVEFGLPHRFQLDLYAVSHKSGVSGPMAFSEQKVELRYALADWGKIWGNPTIYVEWKGLDAVPDHFEGKLLLGGEIRSGWHWGSNFVWEHELAGEQENSNEWTVGISHTVVDSKFALGVETQLALVNVLDANGGRTPLERQFFIGPSMQFRPLPQMHLDLAPLFGTTDPASRAKVIVVLGYEF